ncbi:uncharacterized protein TNCV_1192391 [Trichonephila clavipes]|nr:uncharacterized protein TNCV_1192391 [Trichonephila clavipes]
MLEKVIENWTSRLDYIRASRGSPMPEIIFKIYTRAFGDGPRNFEPWSSDLGMIVGPGSGKGLGSTERENHSIWNSTVVHRTASAAEIRAAIGNTVAQRNARNWLFQGQFRARCPVACIPLTPNHCRLRRQWCQTRVHWWTEWRSVVFSDESRFCLGASNDRVLSVEMLPRLARSPNEYVRDIIGLQLQHHPQPVLTVPVLAQVQETSNSLLKSDIRNLYGAMHARLQDCI